MLLAPLFGRAQYQKILHQTFVVSDSTQQIRVDINGTLELQTWVGNTLLLESTVILENGNRSLFSFLEKSGRYAVKITSRDSILTLESVLPDPPLVTTATGSIREYVQVKLLIPDIFQPTDSLVWKRKVDY